MSIVTFSQWNPLGSTGRSDACLAIADSFQLYLQAFRVKIPYQFSDVALCAHDHCVIVSSRRARPPAVLGVPYIRDREGIVAVTMQPISVLETRRLMGIDPTLVGTEKKTCSNRCLD